MSPPLKSLFAKSARHSARESAAAKDLGNAHLKRNELDDAALCYRRAISLDSRNADAYVNLGFVLYEQGNLSEAREFLLRANSINGGTADAFHILGLIARRQGDLGQAIANFTRALNLKPDLQATYRDLFLAHVEWGQTDLAIEVMLRGTSLYPQSAEFWFYLGNLLASKEDSDAAIDCYQKALAVEPESPDLLIKLGNVQAKRGNPGHAIESYLKALSLQPQNAGSSIECGIGLQRLGHSEGAVKSFQRAVTLEPGAADWHVYLGNAFIDQGVPEKAVACYRQALSLEPRSGLEHVVAALTGESTEQAPTAYVEKLFDQYADRFDSHLVNALRYDVPQQLIDLILRFSVPSAKQWDVLDLGCGTGLAGLPIAPHARRLIGVDLSAKMLEKAKARNLYHRLVHSDLLSMVAAEDSLSYDVVIAADVFVYLGKLDELVKELQRLLRPGGLFAFSVEALEAIVDHEENGAQDLAYRLNSTGRYVHSLPYLRKIAADGGFELLDIKPTEGRRNEGKPVQAYLTLLRRP